MMDVFVGNKLVGLQETSYARSTDLTGVKMPTKLKK